MTLINDLWGVKNLQQFELGRPGSKVLVYESTSCQVPGLCRGKVKRSILKSIVSNLAEREIESTHISINEKY